ncbi:N-acyl homoserine lactonase family protein [Rothia sp. BD8]|uniref:N-acyl homoserine lactonase family protein n=1 Tax=Rothia sp. BD8 TaxID=2953894 RepID=UPI003846A6CD
MDMRAHVLHSGDMEADYTWLLLKPERIIKPVSQRDAPREFGLVPTHAVLVETPEGRMLWDTGVPRDWASRWQPTGFDQFFPVVDDAEDPEASYLDRSLARMGLSTENIDLLVLSHLHFDHAANARAFDNGKTRILTSTAELEGVKGITGYHEGAHIPSDYEGLDIGGISGDEEILPGVTLLQTPGHTWGTMSLMLDLPDEGTKIFTSDAVYMRDSWGPPAVGAAIVWNNLAWLDSVEKLRRIAEEKEAQVFFGHDADQAAHEIRWAPEGHYS